MRTTTRFIALGLAGVMLAACSHKDKDAPLAFVPADTPYVVANLQVMDDTTRDALLAQIDAQLPSQLAQLDSMDAQKVSDDPAAARLIHAFVAEFGNDKTMEAYAKNTGWDLKGHFALYGLGLAPVLRVELADPKAFAGFLDRMEAAYGKQPEVSKSGDQSYQRYAIPSSGTEVILALVGKQAVAALLPADASPALLRQALGQDHPKKTLQDDGRLASLAKTKGYSKWMVGDLELTRALPLALGGSDRLVAALRKAHAEAESKKTGEPVANQLATSSSCASEASRIAARVPSISFGYTKLDAKNQDGRFDIALAPDVTQAFDGLKVALPGLGSAGTAPFDFSLALPVAQLRSFWSAQADAVAAKPFTCPALVGLNSGFGKLGPAAQKAAIPPFGDLLGLRIALDTLTANPDSSVPSFTGRIVLATSNPAGLLAMGQMMVPALAQLKPSADGKPTALPPNMSQLLGQPAWIAMGSNALALGVGTGEEAKLADTLMQADGDAGQMARMHVTGAMYVTWTQLMAKKFDTTMSKFAGSTDASKSAVVLADSKARFAAMKAQAERVQSIDAEVHVDSDGMVITSQTALK